MATKVPSPCDGGVEQSHTCVYSLVGVFLAHVMTELGVTAQEIRRTDTVRVTLLCLGLGEVLALLVLCAALHEEGQRLIFGGWRT